MIVSRQTLSDLKRSAEAVPPGVSFPETLKGKSSGLLKKAASCETVQNLRTAYADTHPGPFNSFFYLYRYEGKLLLLAQFYPGEEVTKIARTFYEVDERTGSVVRKISEGDLENLNPRDKIFVIEENAPPGGTLVMPGYPLVGCEQSFGSKTLDCLN